MATLEYGKGLRDYKDTLRPFRVFGTNGPIGWHSEPLCNYPSVVVGRNGAYRGIHFSREPFYVIDTAFYLAPKTKFDMKWAYYELLTHDINSMDSGSAIRTIDKARDSAASAGSLFLWPAWYCNHFATIAPFSYLYEPPGQNKMDDYIVYIALEVLPPKTASTELLFCQTWQPKPHSR